MRVLVSGSSGLIGARVVSALKAAGHEVFSLVRRVPSKIRNEIYWNPNAGKIDAEALEEIDACIHLAGENIAKRWTPERKRSILESRVRGTRLLSETLSSLVPLPQTLLCASAIGLYGDRGEETLDEASAPGGGFLSEVCQAWEGETESAAAQGIRVALLRFGVVLSPQGGALAKMLLPFRLGVGGRVGSGAQYMSWIDIEDAVRAVLHILAASALQGPLNLVAPHPVTNREFTSALGKVLGRPALLPMPALAARLAFGEMADELLLSSTRVLPKRLLKSGFRFQFPELETALRHLLEAKELSTEC